MPITSSIVNRRCALTLQAPSDDATTAAIAAPTPGSTSTITIAPGPSTMVPYIATTLPPAAFTSFSTASRRLVFWPWPAWPSVCNWQRCSTTLQTLPALMFRETPSIGVSTMMLHHLIVTFKIPVSVCQPVSLTLLAAKSASLRCLFVVCLVRCCAAPGAVHLQSISGIGLDVGVGGPNSSPLVRAWLLTKFCGNLVDTYRSWRRKLCV